MSDTYIPVNTLPSAAILAGRQIICDGVNANRMNDGIAANARIWGVRPPTAAQLAAVTLAEVDSSTTGGVTIGAHIVGITFAVMVGGVVLAESSVGQLPAFHVANAKGQIVIGNLPVSDNAAVNARIIYMTNAGGGILYRIGTAVSLAAVGTINTYTLTYTTTTTPPVAGQSVLYGQPIDVLPYVVASAGPSSCTLTTQIQATGTGAYLTYFTTANEATVPDNTTPGFTIDLPDAFLSATQLSDTNDFLPAKPFCCENQNQIALGGDLPYSVGGAQVTNGSVNVSFFGTGVAMTRAFEGKQFSIYGDNLSYTIDTVNETACTLTLTAPYQGATSPAPPVEAIYQIQGDASTVYFSNPLPSNPEGQGVLAPNSQVIVGGDDGDVINGLGVCRGNWVVGKKGLLYLLTGSGANLTQDKVSTEIGVASHHTMVQDDHGNCIWYAGAAGVYIMSTNQPLCMSRTMTPLFQTGINHARDSFAHAVWYAPRKWYILWVTRAGENNITDLCLIADLSQGVENAVWLGPALEQIRWWPQLIPAVNSSAVLFPDGQQRVLVNGYEGNVWTLDTGELDGVANMSASGTISATDGNSYLDCNNAWFQDDSPFFATNCKGAVVTILSGVAAGQRRFVKSNAGIRLTIDTTFGGLGWFSPAPSVGDKIMVGGYPSYWTPPWLTAQSSRTKRWQSAVAEVAQWGTDIKLEQTVHRAGRVSAAGRQYLPASQRDRGTLALGSTGEILELKLGTPGPAEPWKLRGLTVTGDVGGGIR